MPNSEKLRSLALHLHMHSALQYVAVVENALGKRYDESSNLLTLLNYLRGGVAACNAFDCECLLNFILMRFR